MNTNRNQWIAITILGLAVICLLALFVLNPTKPHSPIDLQPIYPTPTGQNILTEVTAGPQIIICPTEMYGIETIIMGKPVICGNAASATESIATQSVVFTSTPTVVIPATATITPPNVVECYFGGARMTDGHITGAVRFGGAGRCQINAITGEMSLQPYWEQVVDINTILPVGLEVSDVQKETIEPGNDFVWVIAIKRNGIMSYFVADSTESATTFPFWWTSCVSYNYETNTMTFYQDDDGKAGSFEGSCTGIHKEFDGKSADKFSGEVSTYIQAIEKLEAAGYTAPNQSFIFDEIWFEQWPK